MSQKRFSGKMDYFESIEFLGKSQNGAILDERYRVNGYEIVLRKIGGTRCLQIRIHGCTDNVRRSGNG